jgi:hypothetical protein
MSERLRPDPAQFQRSVRFLCTKIDMVATRSGMSDTDCKDLERTFAAMPPTVRDRVGLLLNGTEIQAEYDDPTMAFAARYLLRLAQCIWEENPHPVTHSTYRPRNHSRVN